MPAASDPVAAPRADVHLPALTGLRGVAAGLVATLHLWQFAGQPSWRLGPIDLTPLAICGSFGVDLFFVLSGFLLGLPFVRTRLQSRPLPPLAPFWRRRVRRVLPALWAQLALLFALGWIVSGTAPSHLGAMLAQASLTFNIFETPTLNPVYWSLPIEWNFYMLLPLFALLFARDSARPWQVAALFVAVLAFRVACVWAGREWGADAVPFARWIVQIPGRADQFMLGMLAAWVVLRRPGDARLGRTLAWLGFALTLAMMWYCAAVGDVIMRLKTPDVYWNYTLIALGFAALVAGAALGAGRILDSALRWRPLVFIGVISYSLYLWHYPVLEALRWLGWQQALGIDGTLAWWPFTIACMVLVSAASYYATERPWLPRAADR
jgi:peptidoglycan/LPS O-acetylase OafA/YrhL